LALALSLLAENAVRIDARRFANIKYFYYYKYLND
jgi:hypothetical protein